MDGTLREGGGWLPLRASAFGDQAGQAAGLAEAWGLVWCWRYRHSPQGRGWGSDSSQ